MANRYTVYQGSFVCHDCREVVPNMRFYPTSKQITWLCANNHITKVSLQTRKRKQDYDRKV